MTIRINYFFTHSLNLLSSNLIVKIDVKPVYKDIIHLKQFKTVKSEKPHLLQ